MVWPTVAGLGPGLYPGSCADAEGRPMVRPALWWCAEVRWFLLSDCSAAGRTQLTPRLQQSQGGRLNYQEGQVLIG